MTVLPTSRTYLYLLFHPLFSFFDPIQTRVLHDKLVDLRTYRSSVDGIMMRHVLEHNYDWEEVLAGAVSSFKKKFCLVLFAPFMATTQEIDHKKRYGIDVPDIAFSRQDIERFFEGLKWRLQDNIKTNSGYGVEHVYYVEKEL